MFEVPVLLFGKIYASWLNVTLLRVVEVAHLLTVYDEINALNISTDGVFPVFMAPRENKVVSTSSESIL